MSTQTIAIVAAGVVLYPFIGGYTLGHIQRRFRHRADEVCPNDYCNCGGNDWVLAVLWPLFWLYRSAQALLLGPWLALCAISRAGARIGRGAEK